MQLKLQYKMSYYFSCPSLLAVSMTLIGNWRLDSVAYDISYRYV